MAINKKGLLAGLAGLGLLGVGVCSLIKKKNEDDDYDMDITEEADVEEDEVEDIEEA